MKWRRVKAPRGRGRVYRQMNRVVDGAVMDAIVSHPEYFALGRTQHARRSIVKRVAGAIAGYLDQRKKKP